MNLLIDTLPDTVMVNGREVPINSDFRFGVLFELLMNDTNIPPEEKIYAALNLYFNDVSSVEGCIEEAVDQMLLFYRCGKPMPRVPKQKEKIKKQAIIYDFDHDDGYIYAAFLQQYGIDLNTIEFLHWWSFYALFKSLTDATEIVKIMGYRATDVTKITDKHEKARYTRLKALHALPVQRTREEKIALAASMFGGADVH